MSEADFLESYLIPQNDFQVDYWFCYKQAHNERTPTKVQITVCSCLSLTTSFASAKCRSFCSSLLLLLSSPQAAVSPSHLLRGHLHFAPVPRSSAARILTLPITGEGEQSIPYFQINFKASIFDKVNNLA